MDDVGTSEESADYPVDARVVAKKVVSAPGQRGILACGTGMAMIANRIRVMSAALGQDSMKQGGWRASTTMPMSWRSAAGLATTWGHRNRARFFERALRRHKRRIDEIAELDHARAEK